MKVTAHERVNAERYYLMRYNSAWVESRERDEDKREFEQAHPLYSQLAAGETQWMEVSTFTLPPLFLLAHNIPLEVLQSRQTSRTLRNTLLCIQLGCNVNVKSQLSCFGDLVV